MTTRTEAPPERRRSSGAELASLAAGLCQDAGIELVVAPGGWSYDPVARRIRVSAEGLASEGVEYCAGIVAHEVGHYFISRYTSFPLDFPSLAAGRSLLNAIEDPRVDRWICRRYPGATAWQRHAKVDELDTSDDLPWFLRFCLECAAEGDRDWRAARGPLPVEIVEALELTREARRAYANDAPPTDPETPVDPAIPARWRAEVWPLLGDLRWAPRRREQRVQVSALDDLRRASAEIFPVARELYVRDLKKLAAWLLAHPMHAGAGRRHLEEGRPEVVVGAAMRSDVPPRPAPPWAEELAQELLDAAITGRVQAPLLIPGRGDDDGERRRGWRARGRMPRFRPMSDYDRAYDEVAPQVEQLVQHLERVLRPRRRLRDRAGHPTGRKVGLRQAMAFEADPRRYDELWTRTTIPDRREAVFGLLVDLSGSMQGPKAKAALLGTVLVAETLARLQIPFCLDGFQDVLVPLHDFREPLSTPSRQRIAEMVQEVAGCRVEGNNQPRWNDDAPCLREHAEKLLEQPESDRILVVVSDGLPEGRRSTSADLHAVVRELTGHPELRLVALGLGPHTEHVTTFYPQGRANVPLDRFAATIGDLVEELLVGA